MAQVDGDSVEKKEITKSELNTAIGCGLFILLCSIVSGLLLWRGWFLWLLIGVFGSFFLWAGLIKRFPQKSRSIYVFFSSLNLSLIYLVYLVFDTSQRVAPWVVIFLYAFWGYFLIVSLLLLLVPWRQSEIKIIVVTIWTGLVVFYASYLLNQKYPNLWLVWLTIDITGVLIFSFALYQAIEYLGYKDVRVFQITFGDFIVVWASINWLLYPSRAWLWALLVLLGIFGVINLVETFERTINSHRLRMLYFISYFIIPLLPTWVTTNTWGGIISATILVVYLLLILAIIQSRPVDGKFQPNAITSSEIITFPVVMKFYFYLGILCFISGVAWWFLNPEKILYASWLGFSGYFLSYSSWNRQIRIKSKVPATPLLRWGELTNGVIWIVVLYFTWNTVEISKLLIFLIGIFGAASLERFGSDIKEENRLSPIAVIVGTLLFVIGIWIKQALPNTLFWQVLFCFEGIWILIKGAGGQDIVNTFTDLYPQLAGIINFITLNGSLLCLPFIIKVWIGQSTVFENVIISAFTYTLLFYPTAYIMKVVPYNFKLIIEEIFPEKHSQDKIFSFISKMKGGI